MLQGNENQHYTACQQSPDVSAASTDTTPFVAQTHTSGKKHGWIVAIVALVLVFFLVLFGMWSCSQTLSSLTSHSPFYGSSGGATFDSRAITSDTVGVITIEGTIQYDGTTASPEGLKAQLDRAAQDDHIKAVVLRVDSGGGVATAGEEMAVYVKEFSESCSKPVVVSSASINASAAYEISSQADYIFTAKTTAIGAIGTAMQVTDLSGLLDKLGIGVDNITSANGKDASYGTRPLTEEERAYYQGMVDQINETFIACVAEGRNMKIDEVRALATGMVFTGMDAVKNGLADEIGTKEDAVAKAAEMAGISECGVLDLRQPDNRLSDLLALISKQKSSSAIDMLAALKETECNGGIS